MTFFGCGEGSSALSGNRSRSSEGSDVSQQGAEALDVVGVVAVPAVGDERSPRTVPVSGLWTVLSDVTRIGRLVLQKRFAVIRKSYITCCNQIIPISCRKKRKKNLFMGVKNIKKKNVGAVVP